MRRLRLVVALSTVLALALAGVAMAAKASKVTGGSSQITLSDAAASALSTNHITMTAVAPATASGNTFTFPIKGGRLNTTTLNGVLRYGGALQVSNGTQTARLRDLTVRTHKNNATLYGVIRRSEHVRCHVTGPRHHHRLRCTVVTRNRTLKLLRITNVSVSGNTATGNVVLTGDSAALINRLAGKKIAQAGEQIGTGTTTVTLA